MASKSIIGAAYVCLMCIPFSAYAGIVTFTDNFDDPAFTNASWEDGTPGTLQTWSFETLNGTDLGYHSTVDSLSTTEPASKFINTGKFYNAGFNVESLVRIDSHPDAHSVDVNKVTIGYGSATTNEFYEIGIRIDNIGTPASSLFISAHTDPSTDSALAELPLPILFDTFYKLSIQVGSDQTTVVSLYDVSDAFLGSISAAKYYAFDISDGIGISGRYSSTYNNFNFSGTEVPVPAAIWLFGSGLIGLIGVARRKSHS